jgi:alpha-beta hydrolase superfamily lysophospholipase
MPNAKVNANEISLFFSVFWGESKRLSIHMFVLLWLKVHSGFFSSYNNTILRLAITSAVRKARKSYGNINVIVTGHSMGGAMASFCALDLAVRV